MSFNSEITKIQVSTIVHVVQLTAGLARKIEDCHRKLHCEWFARRTEKVNEINRKTLARTWKLWPKNSVTWLGWNKTLSWTWITEV